MEAKWPRMTTLDTGDVVQTGEGRRGVVVEVDRSGATEWCVLVRMTSTGLVVGYRVSDLVYVGPAMAYEVDPLTDAVGADECERALGSFLVACRLRAERCAYDRAYGKDPGRAILEAREFERVVPDPATTIADAIEAGLDVSSSASRQHYIDTGRFLSHAEVREFER